LDEKFCFQTAGSFIFVFAGGPGGQEGVYFVDEYDTWGEGFSQREECSDEFFGFSELYVRVRCDSRSHVGLGAGTYLETRVEAETEKKVDFACVATALASIVYC